VLSCQIPARLCWQLVAMRRLGRCRAVHVAGAACIRDTGAGLRALCRKRCGACALSCPAHVTAVQACAYCVQGVCIVCLHAHTCPMLRRGPAMGMCDSTAAAIAALHSFHYLCVLVCVYGRFSLQQLVFQHRCLCCADTLCMYRALSQLPAYRFVPGSVPGSHKLNCVVAAFVVVRHLARLWRGACVDCRGFRASAQAMAVAARGSCSLLYRQYSSLCPILDIRALQLLCLVSVPCHTDILLVRGNSAACTRLQFVHQAATNHALHLHARRAFQHGLFCTVLNSPHVGKRSAVAAGTSMPGAGSACHRAPVFYGACSVPL
jgi:hypothetical protein